jgi:hypothetical protein
MSSTTWMRLTPIYGGANAHDVTGFKLEYSIPCLDFTVREEINNKTGDLLKIAMEAGKNQAKAEIRTLLGITK